MAASQPSPLEYRVLSDADELASAAAKLFFQIGREAILERGRFTVALSGGTTPERCYRLLAQTPPSEALDWSRTAIFFGDERCVPRDDPRSNYRMASDALLSGAQFDQAQIYPIRTELGPPATVAADYATQIANFFGLSADDRWPRFDLVFLGLGDDGHTASLFPGAMALMANEAIATASPPGVLPPPVDRVTLTFPVLNAARHVMFLVAGAGKAAAVEDIFRKNPTIDQRPAVGVRPTGGKLIWLLDRAAAAQL